MTIQERKLKEAFAKKETKDEHQKKWEMVTTKSVQKHDKLYKALVTK
ncbi:hypothetical protein [Enterococcus olivae]